MNIALFGYGKTGALVEYAIAHSGRHKVSFVIRASNKEERHRVNNKNTDCVIDFTSAEAVLGNVDFCLEHEIPMVIGTTGWYDELERVEMDCLNRHGAVVWGGNFSIGVNLFFELNKYAATLLKQFKYEPDIREVHHVHKKDAPSGTALVLAKQTAAEMNRSVGSIAVRSERLGDVVGQHTIRYRSEHDAITIEHNALDRKGFAEGAVRAAEWIRDKRGFYNFADVFKQL
jgi:4-hydroxy-tetrahydrodipicolinate reductase